MDNQVRAQRRSSYVLVLYSRWPDPGVFWLLLIWLGAVPPVCILSVCDVSVCVGVSPRSRPAPPCVFEQ